MAEATSEKFYAEPVNLKDLEALEGRLRQLLEWEVKSVADLEEWLKEEQTLLDEIGEAVIGHTIDFYRDTANEAKREIHIHDQSAVQPLLMKYQSEFDKKLLGSPYHEQLDRNKYGLMLKVRRTKVECFREENIPLTVREQELVTQYSELMGGLGIEWNGETKPYSFVQAQLDSTDREVRERAWRAMAEARGRMKPQMDEIMNELVRLRHRMAVNAGFANYRDYMFKMKNREYTIQDCRDFHEAVEMHVIPSWDRLAGVLQAKLGVDTYRPWDTGSCTIRNAPFQAESELMEGVDRMFGMTDPYFQEKFRHMRENGLMDLEIRPGKGPGAFFDALPLSREGFIFSNFSPSFFALIALIHEMGHAVNAFLQFDSGHDMQEHNLRAEVAELYSHAMELLLIDKLHVFYTDEDSCRTAQLEELRRALNMLLGPLSGDMFQHWLYTNPDHTPAERDAKFLEIYKRFYYHPVDMAGLESEVSTLWTGVIHYFGYPFYNIEYSMSMLGALQLWRIYRENPAKATSLYKQGAGADPNQSIADLYRDTGIAFDFSEACVTETTAFVSSVIDEMQS